MPRSPDRRDPHWSSSWDDDDVSIKYAWFDKRGHVSRGGEVPIAALPQMFEFAIREGYLTIGSE